MSSDDSSGETEYWNALLAELGVPQQPSDANSGGYVAVEIMTSANSGGYENEESHSFSTHGDIDASFLSRDPGMQTGGSIETFYSSASPPPLFTTSVEADLKRMNALRKYNTPTSRDVWSDHQEVYKNVSDLLVFERGDDYMEDVTPTDPPMENSRETSLKVSHPDIQSSSPSPLKSSFPASPPAYAATPSSTPAPAPNTLASSTSSAAAAAAASTSTARQGTDEDIVAHQLVEPVSADAKSPGTSLTSTVSSTIVRGAHVSGQAASMLISNTSEKLTLIARIALSQFFGYISNNPYVNTVAGAVNETTSTIQDQTEALQRMFSVGLQGTTPEAHHLERIRKSQGWQSVFLRYYLGTLSWQQRQMIEETKDIYATDENFIKKQLHQSAIPGEETQFFQVITQQSDAEESNKRVLTEYFTAPTPTDEAACLVCERPFGLMLHRHHCVFCGHSVCDTHSRNRRPIFRFGIVNPVRVCDICAAEVDKIHRMDQLIWKDRRVSAFEHNKLIAYLYPTSDESFVGNLKEYSLIMARNALSLASPTQALYDTVETLKRAGLSGFAGMLLQKDFIESIETLKKISGMDVMFKVTLRELTASICHELAVNRGLRGCKPDCELDTHRCTQAHFTPAAMELIRSQGEEALRNATELMKARNEEENEHTIRCAPASDESIAEIIRYAPLALTVIYEDEPVDEQRLGELQDLRLIYAHAPASESFQKYKMRYSLFVTDNSIKKSNTATRPLLKEAVLVLRSDLPLEELAAYLKEPPVSFPPSPSDVFNCLRGLELHNHDVSQNDVYERLHRDDFYPHAEGHICPKLLQAALCVMQEVCPSLNRMFLAGYRITVLGHSTAGALAGIMSYLLAPFFTSTAVPNSIRSFAFGAPCCVDFQTSVCMKPFHTNVILHDDIVPRLNKQSLAKLLRDVLIFRANVFRHRDQNWKEVMARAMQTRNLYRVNPETATEDKDGDEGDEEGAEEGEVMGGAALTLVTKPSLKSTTSFTSKASSSFVKNSQDAETVIVEAEVFPEIFVGGRVFHIFMNRGQYLCTEVSCHFPDLRSINIHTHIFQDHSNSSILNALLEVRAVRRSQVPPPIWVPYHTTNICQCCQNTFTWHSTYKGELQEYRERYNCRHCGALICGPCSQQRRCIPKFGMIFPKRICDKCVLTGDYAELI